MSFSSLHAGDHPINMLGRFNVDLAPVLFRVWYTDGALLRHLQDEITNRYDPKAAANGLQDASIRKFFRDETKKRSPKLECARTILQWGNYFGYPLSLARRQAGPHTVAETLLPSEETKTGQSSPQEHPKQSEQQLRKRIPFSQRRPTDPPKNSSHGR